MAKIAAVSMEVACDTQANVEKFEKYLREAAAQDVDLIVFPECSLQGLPIGLTAIESPKAFKLHEVAEQVPNGENVQKVIALAKENNIYVVWSMVEQDQERFDVLYNTCVLVGPEGYIGKYRKVHQALAERLYMYPGNGEYPVFDTRIGKVGLSVCFDKAYPEVARILAIQGAEIIVAPTAWRCMDRTDEDPDFRLANIFAFSRAMENMVFYVEATHAGPCRMGHSRIIGPNPIQICATTGYDEGMAVAEVDIQQEILNARLAAMAGSDLLKDRKPGTYSILTENNPYVLNYGLPHDDVQTTEIFEEE